MFELWRAPVPENSPDAEAKTSIRQKYSTRVCVVLHYANTNK
jgi:hypothetical protein